MNNNHLQELEELRSDVISDLRELISRVDSIDYDSLKKIAYAIGTRDKEDEGIDIHLKFVPENISSFFPESTPHSVLLECLQSIEQPLTERADYDATDMLYVLKEDMYEIFTNHLLKEIEIQFGYSTFGEANYIPDEEEFVMTVSSYGNKDKVFNLLVKLEGNKEYSVWEISERPKDDEGLSKEIVETLLSNAIHLGNIRLSETE